MSTVTGNVFALSTVNGFTAGQVTFTLDTVATAALGNAIGNNSAAFFTIDSNGNLSYTSTTPEEGSLVCAVVDVVSTDPADCGCEAQFTVCMTPPLSCPATSATLITHRKTKQQEHQVVRTRPPSTIL